MRGARSKPSSVVAKIADHLRKAILLCRCLGDSPSTSVPFVRKYRRLGSPQITPQNCPDQGSFAVQNGPCILCSVAGGALTSRPYVLDVPRGIRKENLPIRPCAGCLKTFAWRKKWARDWDNVRYCSDRCRSKMVPVGKPTPGSKSPRRL